MCKSRRESGSSNKKCNSGLFFFNFFLNRKISNGSANIDQFKIAFFKLYRKLKKEKKTAVNKFRKIRWEKVKLSDHA